MGLWTPPAGANADQYVIRVRIRLTRRHQLAEPPVVLPNGQGALFEAVHASALRALLEAQPYDMLSDASYDAWKEIDINFDPREISDVHKAARNPPQPEPREKLGIASPSNITSGQGEQRSSKVADPYADAVAAARMKRAKQEWDIFLDNVSVVYFAVGCNVFNEQNAQPLITEKFAYFTSRPWIQWDRKPLDEARLQGLAKAKIPNACSFWRENPEKLLEMRREAEAAISRVIGGYSPPLATDEVPSPLSIK